VPTAIVTGSGGLVGSEAVLDLHASGWDVIGVDNDMRAHFFGDGASTAARSRNLADALEGFAPHEVDVRDREAIERLFRQHASSLQMVFHAAAQPSHDWAASEPHTDFETNATGTLNLLEAARRHTPDATFIFISTNKVYGDRPNSLPLEDAGTRLELPPDHHYYQGIDTSMSIDHSTHSLFGVSKAAGDLLVQEYGRYFGMPTVCFRCGCISGPHHAGARLHGFLAYLMKCVVTGTPYTVYGYAGKQVRDNIHSADLVRAAMEFHRAPRSAAVYNMGGGRDANCSLLEAIEACERISGRELSWELESEPRVGDHRWWISDQREFTGDFPEWKLEYDLETTLREIHDENLDQWRTIPAGGRSG
jgi:CDP-paratose 2-epimerase